MRRTRPGTVFDACDLVLLPFPFSDQSTSKRRPVSLLTAPDSLGDFIACAVTSRPGWPHARPVRADDLAEGSLPLTSWVRADKVVTLHIGLIRRRFARVTDAYRLLVAADVCQLLNAQARPHAT
ncbi:MAG: type II toxin-antitoxin system PemK/MazF family toxin [Acetobacteraceae bacterium]